MSYHLSGMFVYCRLYTNKTIREDTLSYKQESINIMCIFIDLFFMYA